MSCSKRSVTACLSVGCLAVCLAMFACLVVYLQRQPRIKFDDYHSPTEWKAVLFEQLPVGSSLDDVTRFLQDNKFRDSKLECGHYMFGDRKKALSVMICKWGFWDPVWLIEFQFDDNMRALW